MHPHPDEKALIHQARQGSDRALGELYQHYVGAVYRYMAYRTPDHMVAEDLTAEVFANMIISIQNYEDLGLPFGAWLFRIARARLADYWRRAKRRDQYQIPFLEEMEEVFGAASSKDPFRYEALFDSLHYLTDAEREVLFLRFAGGLSNKEIAQVIHSNANAVKARTFRALKKLKKILQERASFEKDERV